jgi:hypothetical protein
MTDFMDQIKFFDHLLSKRGISREKAVKVIRGLRENPFTNKSVIICSLGKRTSIFNYGVRKGKAVIETNEDFLVVSFQNIIKEVDSRIQ